MLDTCVLVPAALRDTLLRSAARGLYRPFWSADIFIELERTLVSGGMTNQHQASGLIAVLRSVFPEAEVTDYQPLVGSMTNHPKDRHVIAAAVESGAQVIVTFNVRDFPAHAVEPHGIEVQHPDEFLHGNLLDLDPDEICEILVDQAADLKNPPLSVWQLLDILERQVPKFAHEIRNRLLEP